jgi:hypothetical protein
MGFLPTHYGPIESHFGGECNQMYYQTLDDMFDLLLLDIYLHSYIGESFHHEVKWEMVLSTYGFDTKGHKFQLTNVMCAT